MSRERGIWALALAVALALHLGALLVVTRASEREDGGAGEPQAVAGLSEAEFFQLMSQADVAADEAETVAAGGIAALQTAEAVGSDTAETGESVAADPAEAPAADSVEPDDAASDPEPVEVETAPAPEAAEAEATMEKLLAEQAAPGVGAIPAPAVADQAIAHRAATLAAAAAPEAAVEELAAEQADTGVDPVPAPAAVEQAIADRPVTLTAAAAPDAETIGEAAETREAVAIDPGSRAATGVVSQSAETAMRAEPVKAGDVVPALPSDEADAERVETPTATARDIAPEAPESQVRAEVPPLVPEATPLEPVADETFTPRPRPATVPDAVLRELAAERAAVARQAAERRAAAEEASRRASAEKAAARKAAARRAAAAKKVAAEAAERRRAAANSKTPAARGSPSRASGTSRASASAGATAGNRRTGDPGQNRRAMSSYTSRVHAHLARHKRSPRGRESGTVTVSFTLAASGAAGGVRIARSSGSAALDQEALAMVQRASPFPGIPAEIGRRSMSFSVPVRYR